MDELLTEFLGYEQPLFYCCYEDISLTPLRMAWPEIGGHLGKGRMLEILFHPFCDQKMPSIDLYQGMAWGLLVPCAQHEQEKMG